MIAAKQRELEQLDRIVPGLKPLFFPMRPTSGTPLKRDRQFERFLEHDLSDPDYVYQPKLNGDRVCVIVWEDQAFAQNRHGRWYSFRTENLQSFTEVGNLTVLDGEVYKKHFYPFEALVVNGTSLLAADTDERVGMAEQVCDMTGTDWKFGQPNEEWLRAIRQAELDSDETVVWEGVVRKYKKARYVPLGTDGQESDDWYKLKWAL